MYKKKTINRQVHLESRMHHQSGLALPASRFLPFYYRRLKFNGFLAHTLMNLAEFYFLKLLIILVSDSNGTNFWANFHTYWLYSFIMDFVYSFGPLEYRASRCALSLCSLIT